jgi:hypothetical protein
MNSREIEIVNLLTKDFIYINEIYQPKRVCKTCIMDDSDPFIVFTEKGCNHCDDAKLKLKFHISNIESNKLFFFNNLDKIKKENKPCVLGLSGGVDSSYLIVLLNDYGVNTKSIHLDNHWNSPLASDNIYNLVTKLKVDFSTYVLNWDDFKMQQLSLIYSNVIDLENATDHAIFSTLYTESIKNNNAPIFHGVNINTENIMPMSWIHKKHDAVNLKSIFNRHFPGIKRDFPFMSTAKVIYNKRIRGIQWISALDYFDYDKKNAEIFLVKNFGFQLPKRKHEESLITKIYQRIILPLKFKVDKRKSHLSSMIASGQISREEAMLLLDEPLYTKFELINDLNVFFNKFELTEDEFIYYLSQPQQSHLDFRNDKIVTDFIFTINKLKNGFKII